MCLALQACRNEAEQQASPVVRSVLSVVAKAAPTPAAGYVGTIEPRQQTPLGFRTLGRVVARDAGVGDVVCKGDWLAALDPVALDLAVRSAEAGVASAEAHLANAAATEMRQRVLLARGVTPVAEIEVFEQTRETAAAALARAKADLEWAREQRGYAELVAEFDGVVTAVSAEVGQVVAPGEPVLTIARTDAPEAVVDVPDGVAVDLRPGASFEVALQVDPAVTTTGHIREIEPQSDQATRTRRVRIALPAPPPGFRLGTLVTAVPAAGAPAAVELPDSGLVEQEGRTLVWVVDPATSRVFPRDVAVATRDAGRIEVEGLEPGAHVVVAGLNSLVPGQPVKIANEVMP
jgi:RND family efflux transporter MFP subunit